MAVPVIVNPCCPRCGGHNFGIREIAVQNANFRHFGILCMSCGCVVGTESMQDDDRFNRSVQLLSRISNDIASLSSQIDRITQALRMKGYMV